MHSFVLGFGKEHADPSPVVLELAKRFAVQEHAAHHAGYSSYSLQQQSVAHMSILQEKEWGTERSPFTDPCSNYVKDKEQMLQGSEKGSKVQGISTHLIAAYQCDARFTCTSPSKSAETEAVKPLLIIAHCVSVP